VAQSEDAVLTKVVKWLKGGVKPPGNIEGEGCKLLSYWSQWGWLLLKKGLVFRN